MKKHQLLLLSLLSLFFVSCDITNWADFFDKDDYVKVSPTDILTFDFVSSSDTLVVNSSGEWNISEFPEWLYIEPMTGEDGDELIIVALENSSRNERSATLFLMCGEAMETITVIQTGYIPTNNVDIGFGNSNVLYSYNESTGNLSVTYVNGVLPKVESGNAFVLPAEYDYDIRVIEGVSSIGSNVSSQSKTLSIETSQGNMSDLFYDASFALSMQADGNTRTTRAIDGIPIYEPISCGWYDEQGVYHEIYNESTRAIYPINQSLWSFEKNFNGEYIYKGDNCSLSWDKCSFDASLDGLFLFDFGEKRISEVRKKGDLKKFSYTLTGNVGIDMLMRYNAQGAYSEKNDEIIKKNLHKTFEFKFMVGGVVVPVKVDTHLCKFNSFEAKGNMDITAGLYAAYDMNAAIEWTPDGITKSYSASPQFNVYPLTVEAQATAEAKVSFYPRIEIGIYKFLGPWLEPRPYLKEEIEAGLTVSIDGNNNYGWTATLCNGLDLRTGFDLNFCGLTANVWTSEIYNVVKDRELFEAPKRIRKLTPNDNIEVENGESVEAEFIVESYCPVNNKYYPCPLALVNFEAECGELDNEAAIADENGIVCVEWIPQPAKTRAGYMAERELKAKLVDKESIIIDEEVLVVNVEDSGICNDANHVHMVDLGLSVKWACCNVGATRPEEYGGYYAWGETEEKGYYSWDTYKYWSGDGDDSVDDAGIINIGSNICGSSYDVAYVRWGSSWRMPTREEIEELNDKCSWLWTTLNGVKGMLVTGPNGNSIFLPAAGYRGGYDIDDEHADGCYWSASSSDSEEARDCTARGFRFYSDGYHEWNFYYYKYGHSVRPVCE